MTDTLPAEVNYVGDLWASSGSYGEEGGVITWAGTVTAATPVTITFAVTVSARVTTPQAIVNQALIDDGLGKVWSRRATVVANGYATYLPVVWR